MAVWRDRIDRFASDLIIPGRTSDPKGFIDLLSSVDGLRGPVAKVLSVTGLRDLAAKHPQIGLVTAETLEKAEAYSRELEDALLDANARVAELEEQAGKIAGLVKYGFVVKKVMGRPPVKGY